MSGNRGKKCLSAVPDASDTTSTKIQMLTDLQRILEMAQYHCAWLIERTQKSGQKGKRKCP